MKLRRQAKVKAHTVALAIVGESLHAVGVGEGGERPCLLWHVRHEGMTLSEGLNLLKREKRLAGQTRLVGLLNRSQYRLVSTEAPDLPREEWRDAVRWRLKDMVDFPVDEAVVDVLEVPQDAGARTARSAIALLAPSQAPREMALQADDSGVAWTALEVPETALRNLSALAETGGKAHALMVFGQDHALLVITFKGEMLMTRAIEVTSSSLVDSDESRGGALGRVGLEVLRTLDTYERTNSNAALSGLSVVLPAGAEGILEVLADLVYVPVKAYELPAVVDMSGQGEATLQAVQITTLEELSVLGAALRSHAAGLGRQSVDMRDTSLSTVSPPWGASWGVRAACVLIALLMATGFGMSLWSRQSLARTADLRAELQTLRQATAVAPRIPGIEELASLRETEAQQRRLREVLAGAAGHKTHGYSDVLMALGRQALPGLWITGLTVRDEGRDLELSGRMTDPAHLPVYLGRLQTEERFKGRRFAQLEMHVLDKDDGTMGQAVTQFSLSSTEPTQAGTASTRERP